MKKILLILLALFTLTACNQKIERSDILEEINYSNASKRPELGFVAYQDENLVCLDIPGVGIFLSEYKKNNILAEFNINLNNDKKEFNVNMSKDLKKIFITTSDIYSSEIDNIAYEYDIKTKKLYEVDSSRIDIIKSKEDWSHSLKTSKENSFELKDIIFISEADGKEYKIFDSLNK